MLLATYLEQPALHCPLSFITCRRLRRNLCLIVVKVPGYRPRGPGFDSRLYKILCVVVGLEQDPLRLVRINEGYLQEKK
jgi:hypothetical protein